MSESRVKRTIIATTILCGYGWVVTGVAPFSTAAYLLVALPCVVFVAAYLVRGGMSTSRPDVNAFYRRRADQAAPSAVVPWLVVLVAAVVLESIGLKLGGHSTSVPTLSTMVDHLLARHWERFLFCVVWLIDGAIPVRRLVRLSNARET